MSDFNFHDQVGDWLGSILDLYDVAVTEQDGDFLFDVAYSAFHVHITSGDQPFVHITAVERAGLKDLKEGQRITFEVEPDKKGKGPKAVNLVITG